MKEDKSLEYRIKRLERLIRNNRAVKNEYASVGRKMFAYEVGLTMKEGFYVISNDRYLISGFDEGIRDLCRDGYHTVRHAAELICMRRGGIIIDKPCSMTNLPTVMEYGDFLDSHPDYDEQELSHLDFDDLVFVDKNDQVHELEFVKNDPAHGIKFVHYDLPKHIR